jgi:uncharacterized protein YkwD
MSVAPTLGEPIEASYSTPEEIDSMISGIKVAPSQAESQPPVLEAEEITALKEIKIDLEVAKISAEGSFNSSQIARESAFSNAMTRVLQLTNSYRQQHGLHLLQFNSSLNSAAQAHSNYMAGNGRLCHRCPDGSSPAYRARQYGYRSGYVGENIAQGYRSADDVVTGWMNSSGHKDNILKPNYRDIGIGFNNYYWTQVFGG